MYLNPHLLIGIVALHTRKVISKTLIPSNSFKFIFNFDRHIRFFIIIYSHLSLFLFSSSSLSDDLKADIDTLLELKEAVKNLLLGSEGECPFLPIIIQFGILLIQLEKCNVLISIINIIIR